MLEKGIRLLGKGMIRLLEEGMIRLLEKGIRFLEKGMIRLLEKGMIRVLGKGMIRLLEKGIIMKHGGGTDTQIRVSPESRPWKRKFSRRSSRDWNPRPFNHESGALTTELSPL